MASVTLTQLWLHDAVDPSVAYGFDVVGLKVTTTQALEVRKYANGRYRTISRPGTQRVLSCTVMLASRSDIGVLTSLVGRLLMVRDYTGRLFYGIYGADEVTEDGFTDHGDVALTITEVTYQDTV